MSINQYTKPGIQHGFWFISENEETFKAFFDNGVKVGYSEFRHRGCNPTKVFYL